jgi:ribonuclease D
VWSTGSDASRFTDWSRRPLSEAQLVYAESDVTHLRDIYLALDADIKASGREAWVAEEMAVLNSPAPTRSSRRTPGSA